MTTVKNARKHEQGVALIVVMFIFCIASSIVMAMLFYQQLDIKRTAGMLDQMQAYQYALGAEELARQVLTNDAASSDVVYPGQDWAKLNKGVDVNHGTLVFSIEDLQGRFNLNSLINLNSPVGNAAKPAFVFQRLLSQQNIPVDLGSAVAAEFDTISASYPVSPAWTFSHDKHRFQAVDSVSALRLVDGLIPQYYSAILPFVTVLPEHESPLNVNTASEAVLRAYVPNDIIYQRLINARAQYGFINEQQLRHIGMNTRGMGVSSNYFCLRATADINGHTMTLRSIIKRQKDPSGSILISVVGHDISRAF